MAIERRTVTIAGPAVRLSNAAKGLRLLLCSAARLAVFDDGGDDDARRCGREAACAHAVFDTKKAKMTCIFISSSKTKRKCKGLISSRKTRANLNKGLTDRKKELREELPMHLFPL